MPPAAAAAAPPYSNSTIPQFRNWQQSEGSGYDRGVRRRCASDGASCVYVRRSGRLLGAGERVRHLRMEAANKDPERGHTLRSQRSCYYTLQYDPPRMQLVIDVGSSLNLDLTCEGMDLIALAQTGSGKTAAFALPILQALLEHRRPFFACVLSPTRSVHYFFLNWQFIFLTVYNCSLLNVGLCCSRELAIQIAEQFEALGSAIGLVCSVVSGRGTNIFDFVICFMVHYSSRLLPSVIQL